MLYTTTCLITDEASGIPAEHDLTFDMKDIKRVMTSANGQGCLITYYGEDEVCDLISDDYVYFVNIWKAYKQTAAYNNLIYFRS